MPYRLVIYRQKKKTIQSSQIMRHFITSNFMAEVLYWLKYRITANLKRHFAANTFRCAQSGHLFFDEDDGLETFGK
jgi:hypothetical protein